MKFLPGSCNTFYPPGAVEAKEETKIHAEIETEQKSTEEEARLKAEEEVKMTTHSFVC